MFRKRNTEEPKVRFDKEPADGNEWTKMYSSSRQRPKLNERYHRMNDRRLSGPRWNQIDGSPIEDQLRKEKGNFEQACIHG